MGAKLQTELSRGNSRLADRRSVLITVRVRRPGETWFKSQIADATTTGFRLKSFMKLTAGDDLWIMLPGFEGRRARVQWSRAHESGCVFDRPLHPAILDHIIKISQ
ncbi:MULTISPECIES: pilus assembly protein PilZ [Sphingobium]|uniref:Pilus assembly protein PilZ n=1 Tax=Sphingobium chungbukense TaxID=56193 RepID=A0A0M3ARA2_9SPHN|nr:MULTISPECIES: pilus assembly protein PilZ [Sphingobium]KKW92375.1 pilus assembly protein PilZ [Sphingobium chungbukense]PJG48762.1 pilus assembly protein PilZ [Sphingobium sp. LB126]